MAVPPVSAITSEPGLIGAGLALLLVVWTAAWRVATLVVTVVHEGGHALAAVLLGRGLEGIRIGSDGGGLTTFAQGSGRFGNILMALAGYAAPSLFGLGAAALVARGMYLATLVTALVLLLAALRYVRNLFGGIVVLICGALIGWAVIDGRAQIQAAASATVAWLLLFGGLRDVTGLHRARRGGSGGSDADVLFRLTWIPGLLWVAAFWVVAAAAILLGADLLLGVDLPARS